ncbi:unnamed protein product [Hymenolepis diminuta]|uniref:TAF6 C-terminal HEAT repeat domain-containing protein n=2 Tax=Hymenolepis diminuta TaxID=6216 RepID=A0A3P6YX04_HYMDI|nr:unnamed protein product [Hymenolepis diminuta]
MYRDICVACIGGDEGSRREAMDLIVKSAKSKHHNKQLLAFISEGVRLNVLQARMGSLLNLMRIVKTLVNSTIIPPDYHLYDIILTCITCCACEYDCKNVFNEDLHWQANYKKAHFYRYESQCKYLTDFILDEIYQSFKAWLDCPAEQISVSRLAGIYGILFCFKQFGFKRLKQFVFPNMVKLCEHLNIVLEGKSFSLSKSWDPLANLNKIKFYTVFDKVLYYMMKALAVPLMKYRHTCLKPVTKEAYNEDYGSMGNLLYMNYVEYETKRERQNVIENALKSLSLRDYY